MFPYPSGALHMGHLRIYTTTDVIARYQRLLGVQTLYPMGWDSFGLPAENAAIANNLRPNVWTDKKIQQMRAQMTEQMTLSIDWSREIATHHPEYYHWTQWLFLQLYRRGLAYQRSALVNWDPIDATVLADELVDEQGRSWRSGAVVERRPLRQWYFRTCAYSKSLLDGLDELERLGGQWREVIEAQRGWLGRLSGTQVEFQLVDSSTSLRQNEMLTVFTERPACVIADAIHCIQIAPNHALYSECCAMRNNDAENNEDAAGLPHTPFISKRFAALHPITKRSIPLLINPNLKFRFEQSLDCKFEFACETLEQEFVIDDATSNTDANEDITKGHEKKLSIILDLCKRSLTPPRAFIDSKNVIRNSALAEIENLTVDSANQIALDAMKRAGFGGHLNSSLRSDWLISRQRYWGTPIPIVHCEAGCGAVPVPEQELPVKLPEIQDNHGLSTNHLATDLEWQSTKCPKCGSNARRETDTMDTFVDSSWYFLRFLDARNSETLCDPQQTRQYMPVHLYVGGIEHAIRHLYYARFISHFLYDLKMTHCKEPFHQFLPIGLVMAKTYRVVSTGQYVSESRVCQMDTTDQHTGKSKKTPNYVLKQHADNAEKASTNAATNNKNISVQQSWQKMSKSKMNGVDPADVIGRHSLETVRLAILANSGPDKQRNWQENDVIEGINNWQNRLWNATGLYVETLDNAASSFSGCLSGQDYFNANSDSLIGHSENQVLSQHQSHQEQQDHSSVITQANQLIEQCHAHYEKSLTISVVISRLQTLTKLVQKCMKNHSVAHSFAFLRIFLDLVCLLSPVAPLLSNEIWANLTSTQIVIDNRARFVELSREPPYQQLFGEFPYNLQTSVTEQTMNFTKNLF